MNLRRRRIDDDDDNEGDEGTIMEGVMGKRLEGWLVRFCIAWAGKGNYRREKAPGGYFRFDAF